MVAKWEATYNIPYEEYKFKDKLDDMKSEEESVRQWIISELMTSYGYPKELIADEKVIPSSDLEMVKVYADIAAGIPIEINDEVRGTFKLPKDWIRNKENVFMLHVKGNSMINVRVNNGDLVLIEGVDTADNMDIVAVYYNGSNTLKRIIRMGDTVLLMSENPEYEPINITKGELRVMGKLIGVLKTL